jgi:hypothetical protein
VKDMAPVPFTFYYKTENDNSRDKPKGKSNLDGNKRLHSRITISEMVNKGGDQVKREPDKSDDGHCPSYDRLKLFRLGAYWERYFLRPGFPA